MSSHPLLVPSPYESYKLLWPGKTPLKDNNAKIAWELNFSHTSGLPPQSFKCTACMEFPVFFSDHYIKNTFLGVSGKAQGAHVRLLGNEENGRLHQINWSDMHVGGKKWWENICMQFYQLLFDL